MTDKDGNNKTTFTKSGLISL